MNMHLGMRSLLSLVAGILIPVMPRLLNYIVAIHLIVIGLITFRSEAAGPGA